MARLADAGVRPEDVDVVINTHIHYDHVGWNTRLDGDQWVPTFPNALGNAVNVHFTVQAFERAGQRESIWRTRSCPAVWPP